MNVFIIGNNLAWLKINNGTRGSGVMVLGLTAKPFSPDGGGPSPPAAAWGASLPPCSGSSSLVLTSTGVPGPLSQISERTLGAASFCQSYCPVQTVVRPVVCGSWGPDFNERLS